MIARFFWKALGRLLDAFDRVRAQVEGARSRQSASVAEGVRLLPGHKLTSADGPQAIRIGPDCMIAGQLQTFADGAISIGRHTFIGPNTRIWSHERILIGDRVLIAHDVNIMDSNSHSLSASERHREYCSTLEARGPRLKTNVGAKPVIIGDDAWIGHGVIILKGVRIGHHAIIGAGTIVTRDVDDFEIVVGNPMRTVGRAQE